MSIREIIGLILLTAALIIFPFGYWIDRVWYLIALSLAGVGVISYYTRRVSENTSKPLHDTDHLNAPYIPGRLRGFPGSRIKDSHHADPDLEADGD